MDRRHRNWRWLALTAGLVFGITVWRTSLGIAGAAIASATSATPATPAAAVAMPVASWTALLDHAQDLGASRASNAEVLVRLRGAASPTALRRWARGRALSVAWLPAAQAAVLSGRPEMLGRALGVSIDDYRLAGLGHFYAARADPQVPMPLRSTVASIGRVSSFGQVHTERPQAQAGGNAIVGLGPGGFVDAYDARPLWKAGDLGQGETIVFFEVDGYSQADLATYARRFGLPAFADPLPRLGALGLKPEGESDMDLEVAHAIAPDARLVYADLDSFGKNAPPSAQFAQAFSAAAQRYPGAIWSISLGQCEDVFSSQDAAAVNQAVVDAERRGTTAFAASGDSGGLECLGVHDDVPSIPAKGISFPGDLPAVTSVGGTTLHVTSSGVYRTETTWSEPLLSQGSTGGLSTIFSMPAWQKAPGVISTYSSGATCGAAPGSYCREVPDVAADAAPTSGAAVRFDGRWLANGGTSLATPEWAAFTALIDNHLASDGDKPLGFANPLLYELANRSPPHAAFHEITFGANDFYPAAPGYDMVTGLGSPDVWNIARDLVPLVRTR